MKVRECKSDLSCVEPGSIFIKTAFLLLQMVEKLATIHELHHHVDVSRCVDDLQSRVSQVLWRETKARHLKPRGRERPQVERKSLTTGVFVHKVSHHSENIT